MNSPARLLLFTLAFLSAAFSARADTTIGRPIGAVPYTISKSGHYRLIRNLTMSKATTPAIKITADNVVLDLNGFTITAGPAANIPGVTGIEVDAAHVTVRNGTVIGFGSAVNGYNSGVGSNALLLEDLTCEAQVGIASIYTVGVDTGIRRVRVINPTRAVSAPVGISVGLSSIIEYCSVSDLHAAAGSAAVAYALDFGSSDEVHTALLRDSVGSNLAADGGGQVNLVKSGAKNTVLDRCYFYNMLNGFALGGAGHILVKNSVFHVCGATPLNGVTDGGGNANVP